MQDVYTYIEDHRPETLADLHVFCAQPSVSTEGRGMAEMAALVEERLRASGFQVEVIPLDDGFPVLFAESTDPVPDGAPTLLIYNHYDVQPEGDPAEWGSPPFEPSIRDGTMIARGVADNKANIIARLAAIDAVRAARGGLPVRIKWVIEGEEEIGSPHLDTFLEQYRDRLEAQGCIWEFGTYTWDGTPQIMLGLKGIVEVQLTAHGANRDLHSSMAAYITSPVWRLVLALAAIKDENEGVQIPGFYDKMQGPTDTQIAMIAALPDDDDTLLGSLGLSEFALGLRGFRRRLAEVFAPTCNIQGLVGGYTGPGTKTVLPNQAHAKIDMRIVPDMDPYEIYAALRAHLDEAGFTDVETALEPGTLYPARTDPDHPFVQHIIAAVTGAAGGTAPVVWPSSPASGPMYSFTHGLGLPVVAIGVGNPASAAHGPNENVRLDDLWAGTRQIATVITTLGGLSAADLVAAPAAPPVETEEEATADIGLSDVFTRTEAADPAAPAPAAPVGDIPGGDGFDTDSLFTMPPFDLDTLEAEMAATTAEDGPPADPDPALPLADVFDPETVFALPPVDLALLEDTHPAPPAAAPPAARPLPHAAQPVRLSRAERKRGRKRK